MTFLVKGGCRRYRELSLKGLGCMAGNEPGPPNWEILERGNRNIATRRCEMVLSGKSQREISDLFGAPRSDSVAQIIRRTKEKKNQTIYNDICGRLSRK